MSWSGPEADGKYTFICDRCKAKAGSDSPWILPKGWCVTAILSHQLHPEWREGDGDRPEPVDPEKVKEVADAFAGHFHSVECGKAALGSERVRIAVREARVVLVLYGWTVLVVDGTTEKVHPENVADDGRELADIRLGQAEAVAFGGELQENPEESPPQEKGSKNRKKARGAEDPKGPGKPKGKWPRHKMRPGENPI